MSMMRIMGPGRVCMRGGREKMRIFDNQKGIGATSEHFYTAIDNLTDPEIRESTTPELYPPLIYHRPFLLSRLLLLDQKYALQ